MFPVGKLRTYIGHNASKITIALLTIIFFLQFMEQKKWRAEGAFPYDMGAYNSYLQLAVIQQDIAFERGAVDPAFFFWPNRAKEKGHVVRMTMGVSVLQFPFFITAHVITKKLTSYPADGFSRVYKIMVYLSALVYGLLGAVLLRQVLRRYFSEITAAITLGCLYLGTNLFYYLVNEAPMSHAYNFFLVSALCFFTIKWKEAPDLFYSSILGLILGLIVLIRPVNIVFAAIPVLYGTTEISSFRDKFRFLLENWLQFVFIGIFALLACIPQAAYWKYTTGEWLYYSYGDERLLFNHPHILDGLFSFRKGWFIYTPIMLLVLPGLFLLRKASGWKWILWTVFPLFIYVVYSWWCWWYGGSFGSRPMIDIYPLLAIPFAASIQKLLQLNWYKIPAFVLVLFFVFLNLFQINQYRSSLLHWDSMTRAAYFKIFLKNDFPPDYPALLEAPDLEKAKRGE